MVEKAQKHDIVSIVKQHILEGKLNPGDRIVETRLAKEIGVSQTPVREAMRLLSGEGIVQIVANKSPIVNPLKMNDVFEIYSLRAAIEGLAIRLATLNATAEDIQDLEAFYGKMIEKLHDESVSSLLSDSLYIHERIVELSKHTRLQNMHESFSFNVALVNRLLGTKSEKQKEVDQHKELIVVLKERDPDNAETVMKKHIYRSYTDFKKLLEKDNLAHGDNVWF